MREEEKGSGGGEPQGKTWPGRRVLGGCDAQGWGVAGL